MVIKHNKNRYSLRDPDSRIWNILSLLSISLSFSIFILQWRQLPFFLDMYYHLAVAKGFDAAGGLVLRNFWEYGPGGAPQLYPPLIHILILALLKTGLSAIAALKLLSCIIPSLFLCTVWYVMKNILDKRVAFFAIYLCQCASLFMISISFTPAATIGIALLLLAILSIIKKHLLVSTLLIGLIFYTHTGIGLLSILFVLLAWISKMVHTRDLVKLLLFPLLIGLPWSIHIIKSIPEVSWQNSAQMPLRFYPVIIALFFIGLVKILRDIKKYKAFILLTAALMPIGILYPFRLLCSQSMIGIIILASIGLDKLYAAMDNTVEKISGTKQHILLLTFILLSYLVILAPSINFHGDNTHLEISDSQLTAIFEGKESKPEYITSAGIYDDGLLKKLSSYIEIYSDKNTFIWSNYRYITGMLWCVTQRPALSNMLLEVNPKNRILNLSNGSLLIVIDEPKGEFNKIHKKVKSDFYIVEKLTKEGVDIYILKNKNRDTKQVSASIKPLIYTPYLFMMVFAYIAVIVLSVKYKDKKRGL